MNTTKNDGGPAFPESALDPRESGCHSGGMSLREYAAIHLRVPDSGNEMIDGMIRQRMRDDFAGQALAGIASRPFVPDRFDRGVHCVGTRPSDQVKEAYAIADAMLAARGGEGE